MDVIANLITNVGFPIGVCVMLMWYIREITANHKEESKEFTEALNANTLVMQKLCDKIDALVNERSDDNA